MRRCTSFIRVVIPMSELPGVIYFLKVSQNNSGIKTFKIIKNQ